MNKENMMPSATDLTLSSGSGGAKDINFLTNIDFSQIDEMDPNLFNGHKVIFEQDIELEVKLAEESGKKFLK